jgi:phosphate/sulfate permease
MVEALMILGFVLAAYSVVANDSIQTLGTFLASNSHRPWWVLWAFSSSILLLVLLYGWVTNDGDPAYGRLEEFPKPEGGISLIHVAAPLVLLFLTRFGIPVSTTFLVLSVFAPQNIDSMLVKSLMGYLVAFVTGILVYRFVVRRLTEHFHRTADEVTPTYWIALQWLSTGFLWSQWLIQDLANVFVFLTRPLPLMWLVFAVAVLLIMQGVIFYQYGGRIQRIVTSKSMTGDIRSATIIDFIYGLILLVFKEWSNMPMSTTWVFLGLLAGREIALTLNLKHRDMRETLGLVAKDGGKALAGLAVSIGLAFGLPALQRALADRGDEAASAPPPGVSGPAPEVAARPDAPEPLP